MKKELILKIAEALFERNIGFSVYRFPNDGTLRLAVEEGVLQVDTSRYFWMTPFWKRSLSSEVKWNCIHEEHIDDALLDQITSLGSRPAFYNKLPRQTSFEEYEKRFNDFLRTIRTENIGKAILSRVKHVRKAAGFHPVRVFERLLNAYPDTFVYLATHPRLGCWMGATPELLLDKPGAEFSIMALAGTQRYVAGESVLWSLKNQEEHAMVGAHIEEILASYPIEIRHKRGPVTWHLNRLLHLRTDYLLIATEPVDLGSFVRDLHPTPAVGGLPVKEALACIDTYEGYDRSYYSGIIGEREDDHTGKLYVNLRCMQVGSDRIALYVGGGLTAHSQLDDEWNETLLKSRTMLDVLGDD